MTHDIERDRLDVVGRDIGTMMNERMCACRGGEVERRARRGAIFDQRCELAEAIVAIPGTVFAPPRRISLSRYSLARIRPGSMGRPDLYLYEGMIMPPP